MAPDTITSQQFWDEALRREEMPLIDPLQYRVKPPPMQRAFLQLIGDVRGLRVLEVGFGDGYLSVYLAKMGATVTATDFSGVAVEQLTRLAEVNGVGDRLTARQMDALELEDLGETYDLVVGRFILHHIEPFGRFARVLHNVLVPGGRGVFFENNAQNPFLMLARTYLAGRLGIPKYGDDDEYPLEQEEIAELHAIFGTVQRHYPEFIFFRKLNTYLFRHDPRYEGFIRLFVRLDRFIHEHVPRLHKYSYNQIVEFTRRAS